MHQKSLQLAQANCLLSCLLILSSLRHSFPHLAASLTPDLANKLLSDRCLQKVKVTSINWLWIIASLLLLSPLLLSTCNTLSIIHPLHLVTKQQEETNTRVSGVFFLSPASTHMNHCSQDFWTPLNNFSLTLRILTGYSLEQTKIKHIHCTFKLLLFFSSSLLKSSLFILIKVITLIYNYSNCDRCALAIACLSTQLLCFLCIFLYRVFSLSHYHHQVCLVSSHCSSLASIRLFFSPLSLAFNVISSLSSLHLWRLIFTVSIGSRHVRQTLSH